MLIKRLENICLDLLDKGCKKPSDFRILMYIKCRACISQYISAPPTPAVSYIISVDSGYDFQ